MSSGPKSRKSLPKIFWVLIAAAGVLALVLVAAIILDSNPELQKKWNDWLNSTDKVAETKREIDPREVSCELIGSSEIVAQAANSREAAQLQSTYQEGDQLAVEVFVPGPPRSRRIPILFNEKFAAQASQAQEDKFFCDISTANMCRQDPKAEIWQKSRRFEALYDGGGILEYEREAPSGQKSPVNDFVGVTEDPAGVRLVYNRLGICGLPLSSNTQFTSLKLHDRPWVAAFDPERAVLAMFDVSSWSSFAPREIPRSADRQFAFLNGKAEMFDCRQLVQGDLIDSMAGSENKLLVRVRGRQALGAKMMVMNWDGTDLSNPVWSSDAIADWSGADEGGWAGGETLFLHLRDFTGSGQKLVLLNSQSHDSKTMASVENAAKSFVVSLAPYGKAPKKVKGPQPSTPAPIISSDYLVVEKSSSWKNKGRLWLLRSEADGKFKNLSLPTPENFELEETQARVRWMRLPGNRELVIWQGQVGGAIRAATYRCS